MIMKKKIIASLICALFGSSSIMAQSFSVSDTDTTFYGNITDSDFDSKFILYNDSTTSFPMTWQVESANVEPGWQYSVCDPSACHAIGTSTFDFNMPTSALNRIMNLHYYPNGNAGESTVTVRLFQQDMPNDYVLLTWTGIISTVGINEQTDFINLMIYPNPSTDGTFNIKYSGSKEAELILFNKMGQRIQSKKLVEGNGQLNLNISTGTGVYFYKVLADDQVISESKIVVL